MSGTFLAMRVDTKPFDDIRVRRALNMAVNKKEIVSAYYNGNAELFAYPQHPDYKGYFEPLEAMPASVKELFKYNPDKAKKLLAEAGYPNGFTFKVQVCSCNPDHMDLLPLVAAYLEKVGVKIEIQPMEYAAFLSAMTHARRRARLLHEQRPHQPDHHHPQELRHGPGVEPVAVVRSRLRQEDGRRSTPSATRPSARPMLKEMTREILDKAPYIWLPTPYVYTAWWPWVKNYNGELRAGAVRPGPIYARIWVDQELKKKMGY